MSDDEYRLLEVVPPAHLATVPFNQWLEFEQSLFNRIAVAAQALDLDQLRRMHEVIDSNGDSNFQGRGHHVSWHWCLKLTIANVEAYFDMIITPQQKLQKAALDHELKLKDKEIELKKLELELEQARQVRQEREREQERAHELNKRRLDSVDATIRAVILAQAEFRDNPLAGELVGRFRGIYDTLDKMGYQVDLDEEVMRDLIEQIALRHFTTQTGIKIE